MKTKRDNLPLVIALVLFGLMVAVMLLAVDVAIGQGANLVVNPTFDEDIDPWSASDAEWSDVQDHTGNDGGAVMVTEVDGYAMQYVDLPEPGIYEAIAWFKSDDPDCSGWLKVGEEGYWLELNSTDWVSITGWTYYEEAGEVDVKVSWFDVYTDCTATEMYIDDVEVFAQVSETPTPTASASPTRKPTWTPTPLPEIPWLTENPYFLNGSDYWHLKPVYTWLCEDGQQYDPYAPCVRMRVNGEMWQTFYNDNYGEIDVVALARQDTCPADTVQLEMCLGIAHDPPFACQQYNMPYKSQD
jgi:hypothetical protein